eukprot:1591418-Rhodomonas_salina.1
MKTRLALARGDELCCWEFKCTSVQSLAAIFNIDPNSDDMKKFIEFTQTKKIAEVTSISSIRNYMAMVSDVVTESKRNDRRITTTDSLQICTASLRVLPGQGDDAAVWLPLLCRSTLVLRHMFNEYVMWYNCKCTKPTVNLESEFLFSVVAVHPRFGIVFFDQNSIENRASTRRLLYTILNYNGE